MGIIIGSARIDERGNISGGAVGDQKQKSNSNDTIGEVSMQSFYAHSKGWYILRPIDPNHAEKIAERMETACNNPNIGYDQGNRLGVVTYGIDTKKKTECDCSSLVRECVKEATGKDPGNFNTSSEASALEKTGLFEKRKSYVNQSSTPLFNGDVLVTKTKGHTVIVTDGNPRVVKESTTPVAGYFPKYTGSSGSISMALRSVGCKDTSFTYRSKIAKVNGISNYTGTASQNTSMVKMLKAGILKKPEGGASAPSSKSYYPKYTGKSVSIVSGLAYVGCKDTSKAFRTKIAKVNGISNYTGTAQQNGQLLSLLKAGKLIKP